MSYNAASVCRPFGPALTTPSERGAFDESRAVGARRLAEAPYPQVCTTARTSCMRRRRVSRPSSCGTRSATASPQSTAKNGGWSNAASATPSPRSATARSASRYSPHHRMGRGTAPPPRAAYSRPTRSELVQQQTQVGGHAGEHGDVGRADRAFLGRVRIAHRDPLGEKPPHAVAWGDHGGPRPDGPATPAVRRRRHRRTAPRARRPARRSSGDPIAAVRRARRPVRRSSAEPTSTPNSEPSRALKKSTSAGRLRKFVSRRASMAPSARNVPWRARTWRCQPRRKR